MFSFIQSVKGIEQSWFFYDDSLYVLSNQPTDFVLKIDSKNYFFKKKGLLRDIEFSFLKKRRKAIYDFLNPGLKHLRQSPHTLKGFIFKYYESIVEPLRAKGVSATLNYGSSGDEFLKSIVGSNSSLREKVKSNYLIHKGILYSIDSNQGNLFLGPSRFSISKKGEAQDLLKFHEESIVTKIHKTEGIIISDDELEAIAKDDKLSISQQSTNQGYDNINITLALDDYVMKVAESFYYLKPALIKFSGFLRGTNLRIEKTPKVQQDYKHFFVWSGGSFCYGDPLIWQKNNIPTMTFEDQLSIDVVAKKLAFIASETYKLLRFGYSSPENQSPVLHRDNFDSLTLEEALAKKVKIYEN